MSERRHGVVGGGVPAAEPGAALLALVRRALQGLRFGSVEVVVHDGRVVHVERRERLRVDPAPGEGGAREPA